MIGYYPCPQCGRQIQFVVNGVCVTCHKNNPESEKETIDYAKNLSPENREEDHRQVDPDLQV